MKWFLMILVVLLVLILSVGCSCSSCTGGDDPNKSSAEGKGQSQAQKGLRSPPLAKTPGPTKPGEKTDRGERFTPPPPIKQGPCVNNDETSVFATLGRTKVETDKFDYNYRYSIRACNEDVTYEVSLEGVQIKVLDSGQVKLEETINERDKLVTDAQFDKICILVSDAAVGSNGKQCFT